MLALILALFADPCTTAPALAEAVTGWPADDLARVARRESHCARVGIHDRDAWAAPRMHARAQRSGCVPAVYRDPSRWAVRGAYGASPAYAWCSLPRWARYLPPEAMDTPAAAAVIVAIRRRDLARRYGCRGRTRGECLRRLWRGVGRSTNATRQRRRNSDDPQPTRATADREDRTADHRLPQVTGAGSRSHTLGGR